MGVYIKGMKMPKSGAEHTYLMVFPSGTVHEVRYDDNMIVRKGKAVPVPPHGRLIDATYLKSQGWVLQRVCNGVNHSWQEVMSFDEAPAVIEAEEGE